MSTRLLASTTCCLAILATLPASENGAWPGWRGPAGNGVASGDPTLIDSLPEQPPLVWQADTIDGKPESHSSPAIANGRVYLHTSAEREEMIDGKKKERTYTAIICYALADGKELWRHDIDKNCHATPCTAGDQVVVRLGTGMLTCYNGADGSTVWESKVSKGGTNSSPLIVDGMILTESRKGFIGVKLADGQQQWEVKEADIWNNSPVAWHHQDTAYAIVGNQTMACIEVQSGTVAWTLQGTDRSKDPSSPAIHGDLMATMFEGGGVRVHRLSPSGAELLATYKEFQSQGGGAHQAGSPVFDGQRVFGVDGEKTFCWDFQADQTLWTADKGDTHSSPILIGGKLIVPHKRTTVMLDAATGESLGTAEINPAYCSSPAYADGKLVLNCGATIGCWNIGQ